MTLVDVPDTAGADGLRFTATVHRDPPITANAAVQWVTADPNALNSPSTLTHLFGGEFVVSNRVTAELKTMAVGARFTDRIEVGRYVIVGQLSATLGLFCGTVGAPVACDAAPFAPGASVLIRSAPRDSLNVLVRGLSFAMERAQVTLRTPGVLSSVVSPNAQGSYTFTATGIGETWVVIRVDRALDSVRVVVAP
ncbi:MAG: hypothetical protein KF689_13920 [Gemmatimonadaceae bacterium]|nr:hypothetical protein [Gemmatimonadaceae bacterium]MCW5826917.1 hypothetical protein [Gemmatimonadaceae bacterium]